MPKSNKIYMDYAASVLPNPSSIHELGVGAREKLENARKEVAGILGVRSNEIIFTSGGTEGNNLAIFGVVKDLKNPHIITTNIEHPSVLEVCKYLEKAKLAEVTFVEVEENGIVDPRKIKKALKSNTALVSVMYANNEIGTIQPIREVAKELRHFRKTKNSENNFPIFHTDAVQAINYLELNIEKLGVDLLTLSGSKLEGSDRMGVLYKKNKIDLSPIMYGGDQELGLRPGTENVEAILKFAKAFSDVRKIKDKEIKRLIKLRDYFIKKLQKINKEIIFNGDLQNRLPNNINITIPKMPSDLLVIEFSSRGIMVSSKSACKSGDGKDSHVIKAICKNPKETVGSLRFSFGKDTTKNNVDYALKSLSQILLKLKKWYN